MPCFKGLAVSIHTPNGPLAEHSIQKQARSGRISTYVPVPPAKIPQDSRTGKPEQSTFAVSITLLTPGQKVPYSAPRSTPEDPNPQGRTVGGLPGTYGGRGTYGSAIIPYIPRTTSPNETLAAYIYFDGRPKEEVATLLRRGEETWVNSRWVSIPMAEGGGLAEREFVFREVGLERWLNGLDLVGKDKAAKIEKRHQKLEKRARIKKEHDSDSDEERKPRIDRNGVLRYGNDQTSPVENVTDDGDMKLSDDSDSDEDPPKAEAAGQIKVALFRVLASGEIKRGEYEPQFDVHDDEGEGNDGGDGEDIDHTTSFAKPKNLDPKTISTQTVTGIDPPDSPYATFTFFYRGEKQLQKMGILENATKKQTPVSAKRKSTDFGKLGPLNKFGTVGFSSYRERATPSKKGPTAGEDDMVDSDPEDDDERPGRDNDDNDVVDSNGKLLSPEDARKQGELAEGVKKIKLKRAHSAEPIQDTRKSPYLSSAGSPTADTPQPSTLKSGPAESSPDTADAQKTGAGIFSPFKKHRASLDGGGLGSAPLDLTAGSTLGSTPETTSLNSAVLAPSQSNADPDLSPSQPQTEKATNSDEEL